MIQNKKTFVKFNRNSESYYRIIKKRPSAFILLSLIAIRARRTDEAGLRYDLEIGEALVGDHNTYKVSESVYRTDLKYLIRNGLILKTRTNRRGTVVKLINKEIFDICPQTINKDNTSNKRIYITEGENNTQGNAESRRPNVFIPLRQNITREEQG